MSTDKYDRQIRLWGEGQILISNSRVLCINIDGASTEVLKNLILAGTGYITLVDDKKVDENDLKENFFVSKEDKGKNRAEASLHCLLELNPDVKGDFFDSSPENFLDSYLLQTATFDVIIISNLQDSFNSQIISQAEQNAQRVVLIRNFGLINYVRLYENFHGSFQLRLPDNPVNDLRIASPWNELKTFCLSIDLDNQEEINHKHTPFVVLLIQALEKFKLLYNGNLPATSNEKNEFKQILKSMRKFEDEDNFDEALNFFYFANKDKLNLVTPDLNEIFDILNDHSIEDLLNKTNVIMSNFFIVCKALQVFFHKSGSLPVVGNISDMTSDTETYITLKKIYEKKGKEDREAVTKIVNEIISSISDESLSLKKEQIRSTIISEDINYVDIICKNWPQVHLLHYSNIEEEDKMANISEIDLDEEHHKTNFIWYLLIKASDLFYAKYKRYPGQKEHDKFQEDVKLLTEVLGEYLNQNNKTEKIPFALTDCQDFIFEFCRMSNSKVVPAISVISSIASQEIIKFITYQFRSINNTIIFDGINSTLSTFKF